MRPQFTPNPYRVEGGIAFIALANRARQVIAEARIDAVDIERTIGFGRWHLHPTGSDEIAYVATHRDGKGVYLHRFIVNAEASLMVDHENGDGLDCRKSNLRTCTALDNAHNKQGARRGSASGIRNVHRTPKAGTWAVRIKLHGKNHYFGDYSSIEEAAAVAEKERARLMPFSSR